MKRIRKMYSGVVPNGKVLTTESTSDTDTYSCSYLNDKLLDNYSTEEQVIGTWIDGKPLYRKVLGPVQLPNNNTISIQTGEYSDCLIKKVSACYDYSSLSSSLTQYIPVIPFNDGSKRCNITYSEYQINITTNYDASAYKVYVIIEYTSKND